MIPQHITIVILSLLLLTNCSSGEDKKKLKEVRFTKTGSNKQLTGEWVYNFPFFYSKLTLRNDSTFKFHDQTHSGQNYTEGRWVENDKGIILTSYESFISKPVPKSNSSNEQPKNVRPSKVPPPAFPGPHDTIRIYFKGVAFELNKDTLMSVGDNPANNSYEFVRKKNNR